MYPHLALTFVHNYRYYFSMALRMFTMFVAKAMRCSALGTGCAPLIQLPRSNLPIKYFVRCYTSRRSSRANHGVKIGSSWRCFDLHLSDESGDLLLRLCHVKPSSVGGFSRDPITTTDLLAVRRYFS